MSASATHTPELLTTEQVADLLNTAHSNIYHFRHKGDFPSGYRIGKRVLFDKADVLEWLETRAE